MKYLLDTDHISFLQQRSRSEFAILATRIAGHQPTDFAFSIISFHEQVMGAHTFITRSQTPADTVRGYIQMAISLIGKRSPKPKKKSAIALFNNLYLALITLFKMNLTAYRAFP